MNKCFISGRIVNDLVINYLGSGTAVLNFAVASKEDFVKDGKKVESTEFHSLVAFGELAERIATCFKKGYGISVIGKLRTRNYQHKQFDLKIYKTEIVVDEFEPPIADPKSTASSSDSGRAYPQEDATYDRGEAPGFH